MKRVGTKDRTRSHQAFSDRQAKEVDVYFANNGQPLMVGEQEVE